MSTSKDGLRVLQVWARTQAGKPIIVTGGAPRRRAAGCGVHPLRAASLPIHPQ
ncbi:hypothetical protein [Nocardia sp. NPDC046763]|uniref:hypothetical protein n=1 Tax=Nocardia sp. NPDC046763 TaxID=3155256 RepID=UPI0033D7DB94